MAPPKSNADHLHDANNMHACRKKPTCALTSRACEAFLQKRQTHVTHTLKANTTSQHTAPAKHLEQHGGTLLKNLERITRNTNTEDIGAPIHFAKPAPSQQAAAPRLQGKGNIASHSCTTECDECRRVRNNLTMRTKVGTRTYICATAETSDADSTHLCKHEAVATQEPDLLRDKHDEDNRDLPENVREVSSAVSNTRHKADPHEDRRIDR